MSDNTPEPDPHLYPLPVQRFDADVSIATKIPILTATNGFDKSLHEIPAFPFSMNNSKRNRRMRSTSTAASIDHKKGKGIKGPLKYPEHDNAIVVMNNGFTGQSNSSKKNKPHNVAVFLQKTYAMIQECDPTICAWSTDGDSFIVKDPDIFERDVIPRYFGHSKFSSFARQLNFYGFRKVQSKPIRNEDIIPETAKHLTFSNENFKRDREDLLVLIQRSTRGGPTANNHIDHEMEMQVLKQKVAYLEKQLVQISESFTVKIRNLESQVASLTQKNYNRPLPQQKHGSRLNSYDTKPRAEGVPFNRSNVTFAQKQPMAPTTTISLPQQRQILSQLPTAEITLPPHPKQKSSLPPSLRRNSLLDDDAALRGISALRGVSTLSGLRGLSNEALDMYDFSTLELNDFEDNQILSDTPSRSYQPNPSASKFEINFPDPLPAPSLDDGL